MNRPSNNPAVTVIIPTYNRLPFLKKALDSVFGQTRHDYRVIVVDDGSDDGTGDFIRAHYPAVTYICKERSGPSAARNTGIQSAVTPFIAFLDSDDWWDPYKLAVQLTTMERNPGYLISHTEEIWFRRGTLLKQQKKHRKYHGFIFERCLPLCAVSLSTVIARRELFDQTGLFDESLPCCEDYDFWLRASARFSFLLIDKPLTLKDGGRPDQVSYIHRTGMDRYRIQSLVKIIETPGLLNAELRRLAFDTLQRKCRIYGTGCIKHGREEEGQRYLLIPKHFINASPSH